MARAWDTRGLNSQVLGLCILWRILYCLHARAGNEERHRAVVRLSRKRADFLALPMFISWIGSDNYDMELATPSWALPSVNTSTFRHVVLVSVVFPFFAGFTLFAFGRLIGFTVLTTKCLNAPWLETRASRGILTRWVHLFASLILLWPCGR